jgi:Na+/proline symporter
LIESIWSEYEFQATYHAHTCLFYFDSVYYGPDSIYATYEADTCSAALGLAQCAMWVPDGSAFIKLLTHQVSPFLGAWGLIGIIAASMSTASGAILAMGTVMAHNVARQLDTWFPTLVTPENLLNVSRMTTVPFTIASTCIAAFYRSSSGGGTGYLLIVAFDIVLATVVVPLFGCFYCKKPSPRAALLGICGGAATRIILEFVLPKDGFLILPFDDPVFFNYGTAPNALFPFFVDVPVEEQWNPADGACQQEQYTDYTGVDSLCSPLVCLFLFCMVQVRKSL